MTVYLCGCGSWAEFTVTKYNHYSKPGKYGDDRQRDIAFDPRDQPPLFSDLLPTLAAGDAVTIAWEHRYYKKVTADENGDEFTAQYPERIVTAFAKST